MSSTTDLRLLMSENKEAYFKIIDECVKCYGNVPNITCTTFRKFNNGSNHIAVTTFIKTEKDTFNSILWSLGASEILLTNFDINLIDVLSSQEKYTKLLHQTIDLTQCWKP